MSDYNDDRTPSEGGLFSDDYETPKRENPYLRKNREKNQPTKEPKPEKPKKDKNPRARSARSDEVDASFVHTEDKPAYAAAQAAEPAEDGQGYRSRRTFSDFMFEHVKLIVAIVTVAVVLTLVLATDVVSLVENLITQSEQADKEPITLLYVEGLTKKSDPITWSDFSRFQYDATKADDSVTWMLAVDGTDYEVWISGVSTQAAPIYVYLFDMRTGDKMDLNKDDLDAFVAEHP